MTIDISFTLTEQDLEYFRRLLHESQRRASGVEEADIIRGARQLLDKLDKESLPAFFLERLDDLRATISMLEDPQWPLEREERTDIVSALAYLYDPDDAIADEIPALGMLDDAIIIELVLRELRHEIEAYKEFCEFRAISQQLGRPGVSQDEWLGDKQHQLFERMRERMERHHRTPHGAGRLTTFSLS